MNREEELKAIIEAAQDELYNIREAKTIEKNKAVVGKFFKFRCEDWWVYIAVTGVDESGSLGGWSFQVDFYGRVEIEPTEILRPVPPDGHIEIEPAEFWAAWKSLMDKLATVEPAP